VQRSDADIRRAVINFIREAERRQTPVSLATAIAKALSISPHQVRAAIKALLQDQHLIYSYEMGSSYLRENTLGPWSPIPGFWMVPPDIDPANWEDAGEIVISMGGGAAFGSEGHPTTRLGLQALYELLGRGCTAIQGRGLDIGSGSGILALAAVKMGCTSVLALDRDPCARHETQANIRLNHLEDVIRIDQRTLDRIDEGFDLIMANLRFPTLKEVAIWAGSHLHAQGVLVVSGLLREELDRLKSNFASQGFESIWEGVEKRWAAGCFKMRRG
jgi:ribosomal protein L11 methyltransferase